MTSSSGIQQLPHRLENIPKNIDSYQLSSITCGVPEADKIQLQGQLIFDGQSRLTGLLDPQSNNEPVTLNYLQQQQQYAQSDVSVGTIQIWFKTTIPADYLLCNGSTFNISTYPELYQVLGTNVLPDLRNQFIRGASSSVVGQQIAQSNVPIGYHAHSYDKYTQLVTFTNERIYAPLDEFRTYVSDISASYTSTLTSFVGSNSSQFYPAHMTVHFIIKAKSTRAFRNSIQNDNLSTASLIANIDRLLSNIKLDMGGQKIINVQTPTSDNDVATKFYVDQSISGGGLINKLQNGVQTLILQPTELQTTVNMNMQTNKIVNLGNATQSTDALNLQTGDTRYYLNSTPLQNITLATSQLNVNSQRITNVGNATQSTDALNLQTADNRFYLNSTPLQNITLATSQVNMNSQKISNMATGILFNDGVILEQLQQWIYLRTDTPQLANLALYPITFQEQGRPSSLSFSYQQSQPTLIQINQSGINIRINVQIRASYSDRTKRMDIRLFGSVSGIIEQIIGVQPSQNNESIDTSFEVVLANVQAQTLSIIILPTTTNSVTIQPNSRVFIQRLY